MISLSWFTISAALAFGILYFIFDEIHGFIKIHNSFIAGATLSYFFIIVLPEISQNIPEYPLHLVAFEYAFVLLGFAVVHISEKLVLQKVEVNAKLKARELLHKRKVLEQVEDGITKNMSEEFLDTVREGECTDPAIIELIRTVLTLKDQEERFKQEIISLEDKISRHINDQLDGVRWIIGLVYHFFIGFIVFGLLEADLFLDATFFFIFTLLMALISIRYQRELVIPDLEVSIEYNVNPQRRLISAGGVFIGSLVAIIINLFIPLNLEFIYLLFSFVSGAILYPIVRDVIPQSESGRPIFFVLGCLSIAVVVFLIQWIQV